jgi:hypothetical protein
LATFASDRPARGTSVILQVNCTLVEAEMIFVGISVTVAADDRLVSGRFSTFAVSILFPIPLLENIYLIGTIKGEKISNTLLRID